MTHQADPKLLAEIDAALARRTVWLPLPPSLRTQYQSDQLANRRPHNRLVILCLILLFDLFWLTQFSSAPELVFLSGIFRLALLTPLGLLFLWLDRRDRLGRCYEPALLLLAVAPALITAVLCLRTTSSTTLSDVRATPLILLTTGLVARLTMPGLLINTVVSSAAFIGSIVMSHVIPRAELSSLILTDLCIATACFGFNLQMENRDRRVFLLQTADAMRRAELAVQNVGLRQENQTDALTGVANRRCFDETLAAAWKHAQSDGGWIGLIMIDVDHFKSFNDHYGHQGGDDCLRIIATQARLHIRAGDLLARYGGEEFAVILPSAPLAVVADVAERIRAAVEQLALPHAGIGPNARVTISLGVTSMLPLEGQNARCLIEAADSNLYQAKAAGRNRLCADHSEWPGLQQASHG